MIFAEDPKTLKKKKNYQLAIFDRKLLLWSPQLKISQGINVITQI